MAPVSYGDLPSLIVLRQFQEIGSIIIFGNGVPTPNYAFLIKHDYNQHVVVKSIIA